MNILIVSDFDSDLLAHENWYLIYLYFDSGFQTSTQIEKDLSFWLYFVLDYKSKEPLFLQSSTKLEGQNYPKNIFHKYEYSG